MADKSDFKYVKTKLSNVFLDTYVGATGRKSFKHEIFLIFETGIIVDSLKSIGIKHVSNN